MISIYLLCPILHCSTWPPDSFTATRFSFCFVLFRFILHSSFVFDPTHWFVPSNSLLHFFHNNVCHNFITVLHRSLLGERAPFILFVNRYVMWTTKYTAVLNRQSIYFIFNVGFFG